jgi:hypothetical protein
MHGTRHQLSASIPPRGVRWRKADRVAAREAEPPAHPCGFPAREILDSTGAFYHDAKADRACSARRGLISFAAQFTREDNTVGKRPGALWDSTLRVLFRRA